MTFRLGVLPGALLDLDSVIGVSQASIVANHGHLDVDHARRVVEASIDTQVQRVIRRPCVCCYLQKPEAGGLQASL
jgi:hypothetical protein